MEERKRACDEEVLRISNEPRAYAEGALKVCKLYVQSSLRCMSGVSGSNLKARIQAILSGRIGRDLGFAKKVAMTTAVTLGLAAPVAVGVLRSAPVQSERPSFEVASVKRDNSIGRGLNIVPQAGGRLVATGATLSKLIAFAYAIQDFQIVGASGWVSSDRWEIEATTEDGSIPPSTAPRDPTKPGPIALGLQSLLADRFGLRVHKVIQELPVYQLSIASTDLKMKLSEDQTPVNPLQQASPASQYGRMRRGALGFVFGGGHIEAAAVPVSQFAGLLSIIMDRPIIDKTGLTGLYDIDLNWTPDPGQKIGLPPGPLPPGIERPPVDPSGPSIFSALQDQLGLRLQSAKGPVEVVVIDDARKPMEN